MNYIDKNKNYTNPDQSGVDSSVERVGDLTNEPAINKPRVKTTTSKMANLLEGLQFPATKEEILNHINQKSPLMGNRINDVFEIINNNLEDGIKYQNAYDIGLATNIVEKKNED